MSEAAATAFEVRIAPQHDARAYAETFRRDGRLHIPNFLHDDDARRLFDALAHRTPWRLMLVQDGAKEITQEAWAALPPLERQRIEAEFMEKAKVRFVGRFCALNVSGSGEVFDGDIPELVALSRFFNTDPFLSFVRTLTGSGEIDFADAQATLYRPGDFLHPHDDLNGTHNRIAAYILNLTPRWKPEWGGMLAFLDPKGNVAEGYVPTWNAFNILRVPQVHFVSHVGPFATAGRYSVTGWLRRR